MSRRWEYFYRDEKRREMKRKDCINSLISFKKYREDNIKKRIAHVQGYGYFLTTHHIKGQGYYCNESHILPHHKNNYITFKEPVESNFIFPYLPEHLVREHILERVHYQNGYDVQHMFKQALLEDIIYFFIIKKKREFIQLGIGYLFQESRQNVSNTNYNRAIAWKWKCVAFMYRLYGHYYFKSQLKFTHDAVYLIDDS